MSQSPPDSVRLARTSDVDDVARAQVAAWRSAYAGVLPEEVLQGLDADEIAWEWGRALLQPGPHRLLVALDAEFPHYGFAQNKGYGTPEHLAALARHGPCPAHRRTFAPVAQTVLPF